MRYLIGILFISLITFASCNTRESKEAEKAKQDSIAKQVARGKYLTAIADAEKVLYASKNFDQKLSTATLRAYNDFTVTFPNDSMTAEYLFRASDLAQGIGNYQQAAIYLETIIDLHKDYKKYADACFMAAYIYDTFLEDVNHGGDRAKQLYKFVIDNYPNTKLAEDSKVLRSHVGQSDAWIDSLINKGGK